MICNASAVVYYVYCRTMSQSEWTQHTHTLLGSDVMASSCDNEPTDLLSDLTQLNLKKSFVTKSFVNSKVYS